MMLRIETDNRWDALALATRLNRYRWYLVEPDSRHFDLCIAVDVPTNELPDDLRAAVDAWLTDRGIDGATIESERRAWTFLRH